MKVFDGRRLRQLYLTLYIRPSSARPTITLITKIRGRRTVKAESRPGLKRKGLDRLGSHIPSMSHAKTKGGSYPVLAKHHRTCGIVRCSVRGGPLAPHLSP